MAEVDLQVSSTTGDGRSFIQTIIINLALLPLRLSQMKSMLKMQRVAPQIKAIQEKYKKYSLRDPKKAEMNDGDFRALQERGRQSDRRMPAAADPDAIPVCLLPHARSGHRPAACDMGMGATIFRRPTRMYILPIAIVITMFFMQRMTPQAGMDPTQQKMMNFMMPAMLGYISLNLASGLCLYWAMGQLIGIVQQSIINRSSLGREMREMMEKRARKKEK